MYASLWTIGQPSYQEAKKIYLTDKDSVWKLNENHKENINMTADIIHFPSGETESDISALDVAGWEGFARALKYVDHMSDMTSRMRIQWLRWAISHEKLAEQEVWMLARHYGIEGVL